MGVDGLLIVTPFYNKCTQEGIIEHYNFIADRVSTPVIVYNVPSRTGVNILPETYAELAKHKNICAVKEASDNISTLSSSIALTNNQCDFYTGNDDMILSSIATGAKGVISVASNIIPSVIKEITHLCLVNDFHKANEIYMNYLSLLKSLFIEVNPIPVKYACSKMLGTNNTLRLPLTSISKFSELRLQSEMEKLRLI